MKKTVFLSFILIFVGSMLAPLAVLCVFYMLFGHIPSLPIAVVDLDGGRYAEQLSELAQTTLSPFGDAYLAVHRATPARAEELFRTEKVVAVLTIPESFSEEVAQARTGGAGPDLHLRINNVNSDLAKNVRLYTTQLIGRFYEEAYGTLEFDIKEELTPGVRTPWIAEIGVGLIAFSVSLAGMFNAASSLLREYEEETLKELLLAPRPAAALLAGKVVLALSGAFVSGAVMYLVVFLFSGQLPGPYWGVALVAVLMLGLTYTGLGLLFGFVCKRYIPAAFCSVLTGFVSWFLGGALGPVAQDGSISARIAPWLPTTHAIALLRDSIIWHDLAALDYHLAWLTGLLLTVTLLGCGAAYRSFRLE